MLLDSFFFCTGLLMLYYGASWLVRGSSSLAKELGIKPVVIGLTVVAFGTSTPEIFVSIVSSIQGKGMIAVGNAVGSNICNIALVLGITALFSPIPIARSIIKYDIPIMLGISLYLLVISFDSQISRFNGFTLFSGIIIYTFFNYYFTVNKTEQLNIIQINDSLIIKKTRFAQSRSWQIILILLGIAGVITGADMLVDAAIKIMYKFNVNEKFIGLTIIAFGTSLPELATSVVSAIKREMDISIGNLIGSNVFNILCVLGAASLIRPITVPGGFIQSGLMYDYLFMIFVCLLLWVMIVKTSIISRMNGGILLIMYTSYIIYLL